MNQVADRYEGVVSIPTGKSGKLEVRHRHQPAGFRAPLNLLRTAVMGGQMEGRPTYITYDYPTMWHELWERGQGVWMTDLPVEQQQHETCLESMTSGSVLVGGLGIGLAVHLLAARPHIERIVVVEKSSDVIDLVMDATLDRIPNPRRVSIVNADLFEYLRVARRPPRFPLFDHAFFDIWQSDGEGEFHKTIVSLIRLADGVVTKRPVCWNEDVMRGQLRTGLWSRSVTLLSGMLKDETEHYKAGLTTRVDLADPSSVWVNWSVPYYTWVFAAHDGKPLDNDLVQAAATFYASVYGLPGWERRWREWVKRRTPTVRSGV